MFRSFPKGKRKLHKNSNNIQKIEKYHYGFIPNPNRMEKAETERKEKLSPRFGPSRRGRENSKKIAKKLKKLKNTITASFQAKICWKRLRKREKKKLSLCFVPSQRARENSKKIAKKFKKFKNTTTASFHTKIGWKRLRKREKKNYGSDQFLPDPN